MLPQRCRQKESACNDTAACGYSGGVRDTARTDCGCGNTWRTPRTDCGCGNVQITARNLESTAKFEELSGNREEKAAASSCSSEYETKAKSECSCSCSLGIANDGILNGMSLASVYSPFQEFHQLYDPREGLCRGTVFCELNKPFCAYGRGK